jgi:hypothetical protein
MRVDNKSGFTGVHWYKPYNKWVAKVKVSGKAEHLGYFKDINKGGHCTVFCQCEYKYNQC